MGSGRFKVGYLRCLWYAVVANFVSAAIGMLWMVHANEQEGWKWAGVGLVFAAVAVANVVSYSLSAAIMLMFR